MKMEKTEAYHNKVRKWIQLTKNKQIIGNQGLHFVAFMLSRRGFNLAITARNSKGADILIYNDECDSVKTIQVKSVTDRYSVNVGSAKDKEIVPQLICDYWIFVNLGYASPRCYIFTRDEAQAIVKRNYNAGKDDKFNWWLQRADIYLPEFEEKWEKISV